MPWKGSHPGSGTIPVLRPLPAALALAAALAACSAPHQEPSAPGGSAGGTPGTTPPGSPPQPTPPPTTSRPPPTPAPLPYVFGVTVDDPWQDAAAAAALAALPRRTSILKAIVQGIEAEGFTFVAPAEVLAN